MVEQVRRSRLKFFKGAGGIEDQEIRFEAEDLVPYYSSFSKITILAMAKLFGQGYVLTDDAMRRLLQLDKDSDDLPSKLLSKLDKVMGMADVEEQIVRYTERSKKQIGEVLVA